MARGAWTGAGATSTSGAGTGAGTGAIPDTTGVRQTMEGSLSLSVLLPALAILLPSTPKTTLLNISSTFICRLFIQDGFLPAGCSFHSCDPLGNLKGGERGVVGGENNPWGNGMGTAGGGVGAVTNSLIWAVISRGGRHCSSSCLMRLISKGSLVFMTPAPQAKMARPLDSLS